MAAEPAASIRKKVSAMVAEIETKAALRREVLEIEPLGMERVRRQNPLTRPLRSASRIKPAARIPDRFESALGEPGGIGGQRRQAPVTSGEKPDRFGSAPP